MTSVELPRPMVGDKCYLYRLVCYADKEGDGIKRISGTMKCYEAVIAGTPHKLKASYYENGKRKIIRISDEGYNHVFFNSLVKKNRDDSHAIELFRKAELARVNAIKRELTDACGKHTMLSKMQMSIEQAGSFSNVDNWFESAQYEYFWD